MNTNTTALPDVVARYLDAANRFDAESAAACFTPEATVRDEGQTHAGTEAIRKWVSYTSKEYQPQVTVVSAELKEEKLLVAVTVTGQFPGSPTGLEFGFTLRDGKIAELSIR